jgi:hypothetical protein
LAGQTKNKVKKGGVSFDEELGVVSSHVFTTNSPRFTIQKPRSAHPKSQKTPAKTPLHHKIKKQKKEDPETVFAVSGSSVCRRPVSRILF